MYVCSREIRLVPVWACQRFVECHSVSVCPWVCMHYTHMHTISMSHFPMYIFIGNHNPCKYSNTYIHTCKQLASSSQTHTYQKHTKHRQVQGSSRLRLAWVRRPQPQRPPPGALLQERAVVRQAALPRGLLAGAHRCRVCQGRVRPRLRCWIRSPLLHRYGALCCIGCHVWCTRGPVKRGFVAALEISTCRPIRVSLCVPIKVSRVGRSRLVCVVRLR